MMKKLIVSFLMLTFSVGALAETAYVTHLVNIGTYGAEYVAPCPQTPAPVPANGYCYEGRECPAGYDAVPTTCWGSDCGDRGFVCKNNHMWDGN
jgi:hypothetical protein